MTRAARTSPPKERFPFADFPAGKIAVVGHAPTQKSLNTKAILPTEAVV